jgi:hypothetical protein
MLKRVTWLGVGFVAGAGASKWLGRKARRRLGRYLPVVQPGPGGQADLGDRARRAAGSAVADLRYALEEGRTTMAQREAELRQVLGFDAPGQRARSGLRGRRGAVLQLVARPSPQSGRGRP